MQALINDYFISEVSINFNSDSKTNNKTNNNYRLEVRHNQNWGNSRRTESEPL